MNKIKITLFILFLSLMSTNVLKAQFLERLNKRVQRSAENAAINKAEQIAADKAGEAIEKGVTKGLESIFTKKMEGVNSGSIKSVDASKIPDSYTFEWMYTMQMQTNSGLVNIDYFLKPNATYFGSKVNMEQSKSAGLMFMVTDFYRNINTIFMETNGSKMAMPTVLNLDVNIESDEKIKSNDFSFKKIGTKTILGYKCQGFKAVTDEATTIIYVTNDSPVSFNQLFGSNVKSIPKGFDPKMLSTIKNGLIMEMEYTSKEDKNNTTTLKCVILKKNPFTINKSDYQFMNMNLSN